MYNGVGLRTPRGSGTSGYTQANKFVVKPRASSSPPSSGGESHSSGGGVRKPNKEIREHDRKRQVELRLVLPRDALEEQGYTEAEVEELVAEARAAAEAEGVEDEIVPGSHHAAVRKERQTETMRAALVVDEKDRSRKQ